MKTWVFWLTEYIHFYALHILASAVFIIAGFLFKLSFFTLTQPGAYILLFFIWGHTQIAMSFFISTLFNRSRVALSKFSSFSILFNLVPSLLLTSCFLFFASARLLFSTGWGYHQCMPRTPVEWAGS